MLIATDNVSDASKLARQLGAVSEVTLVTIENLPAWTACHPLVVCDFDLTDKELVAKARSSLETYRRAKVPIIFLLAPNSFHETAQAHALGADTIIARDHAREYLPPVIDRIMAASVTQAVDATLVTFEGAFAAAAAGRPLGQAQIIESSTRMLDAISAAGISRWLNQSWSIDEATSRHSLLVAGICAAFAIHLGLARSDRVELTHAAMLHDVGKARIPAQLLNKPGLLDRRERAVLRQHPVLGWDLLKAQKYEGERLLDAVVHHHEFLDGSGYPDNLRGARISDFVRIVTICDIFGALLEERSYKSPQTPQQAIDTMQEMDGKLDNDLMRVFTGFVGAQVQVMRPEKPAPSMPDQISVSCNR